MKFDYKIDYHRYKHYYLRLRKIQKQPATQASITVILTLLMISFFGLFAIKPTAITIAKLIKQLKDDRKTNEILTDKVTNLTKLQHNYQSIEDDLVYLNRSLPEKADFNRLAREINYLAFNHDLILSSATFEKFEIIAAENNNQSHNLKFSLSVAGDFINIKKFISDLENLDRIVQVKSVGLTTQTNISNAQIQANFNSQAYWLVYRGEE